MMSSCRIVIADDHRLFCEGIKRILQEIPGIEVVGIVHDGLALLELLKTIPADLVVMDISMPNLRGIEATHEIKSLYPDIKVLMLTMHNDKEYLYHALKTGADGFLLKQDADDTVEQAITMVRKGKTFVSSQLSGELTDDLRLLLKGGDPFDKDILTIREKEILKLIAEGKTSPEISEMLYISSRTVENHRANLIKKLNFRTTADLIKYAIRKGYTSVNK